MAICWDCGHLWERAVPLAFHLWCFCFSAVLIVGVTFPTGVYSRVWNSIISAPDHCLSIYCVDARVDELRNYGHVKCLPDIHWS